MQDPLVAVVRTLIAGVRAYLLVGLLVGVPFVIIGVQRIDSAARDGFHPGFRLVLLPGVSLFWPLLLRRWWQGSPPPRERTAHRRLVRP
jgi:hypothetical protein